MWFFVVATLPEKTTFYHRAKPDELWLDSIPRLEEVLAGALIAPQTKAACSREILTFLKYCKESRAAATTELAKKYLAWREKPSSGPAREALRWFYREGLGRMRSAAAGEPEAHRYFSPRSREGHEVRSYATIPEARRKGAAERMADSAPATDSVASPPGDSTGSPQAGSRPVPPVGLASSGGETTERRDSATSPCNLRAAAAHEAGSAAEAVVLLATPPYIGRSRPMEPPPAASDLGSAPWERDLIKACRKRNFLWRTEQTYREWAVRFAWFIAPRSPYAAAAEEVAAFLSALAVEGRASPSAQKQALNALVFLMEHALNRQLGEMDFKRAYPKQRLPTVLSQNEVRSLLAQLEGTPRLMVELAYGAGLRLMELLRLRVHHLDLERLRLQVFGGKGTAYTAAPTRLFETRT